jgi:hypothetical protein
MSAQRACSLMLKVSMAMSCRSAMAILRANTLPLSLVMGNHA